MTKTTPNVAAHTGIVHASRDGRRPACRSRAKDVYRTRAAVTCQSDACQSLVRERTNKS